MAVAMLLCVCASERLTARQCPDGSPPPCRISARPAAAAAPDSHVIAVLPFRVSGADSALAEGLAELLAVEFTGEGTLRAADMGTVLRAWRSAGGGARRPLDLASAQRLATRIGAGRMLTASVVGTGQRLSLSAQVLATSDGAVKVRAGPVQGTMDSLPDLMRQLAAQLLSLPSGVRGAFSLVPTEALRTFIAARAAYRASDWNRAAQLFERAIQIDSTFAYAALGRIQTEGWTTLPAGDLPRIRRLAFAYRDRMDPIHRALTMVYLGPRYPELATAAENIVARTAVTQLAPDNADAWMALGDELAHRGALVLPDGFARAIVALERALALDSGLSEAALHLSTGGLVSGNHELTRRYAGLALRIAPNGPWVPLMRFDLAIIDGRGGRYADSLRGVIRRVPQEVLTLLPLYQTAPDIFDTALTEAALMERLRRAGTSTAREAAGRVLFIWLMNRGRPRAADAVLVDSDPLTGGARVASALFDGGDTALGSEAVERLDLTVTGPIYQRNLCLAGLWAARRGETAVAQQLRAHRENDIEVAAWCPQLIEATVAVIGRQPAARTSLAVADSLVALGMPSHQGWEGIALGHLWAAIGEHAAAVRAIRRVEWFGSGRTGTGALLATRLRLEGRWATLAGDSSAARVAYRRYLRFRDVPEPSLVPQRDSVIAELERLGR